MDVVSTVTLDARCRQRNLGNGLDRVAGMTIEAPVRSIQCVSGL